MAFHQINGVRVRTTFEYPPIPVRSFDWSAIDDDSYDGADDSNCPIGHGATEEDAIADLLAKIGDRVGWTSLDPTIPPDYGTITEISPSGEDVADPYAEQQRGWLGPVLVGAVLGLLSTWAALCFCVSL